MTVHVSVRSISALLLLSLLGLPASAPAQSVVAPQKTAPPLEERLDRLAAEFDRNRIDLRVPGAVLAIVRGEEVIMALRRIPAASAIATIRTTGTVRFPQSAVEGRFSSSTAGDDRLRTDLDLDGSVQIRTVLNNGRASAAVSGAPSTELTGKLLAQTRLGHSYIESNEMTGRAIYQADRAEVNVDIPPDTFTLQPTPASDRGR